LYLHQELVETPERITIPEHKMGYPDSFEGFMIEDQKKWTEFKKKEV
jgi:hypothetical protein